MDTIESAKIKDDILRYLSNCEHKKESLEAAIFKLKLENVPNNVIKRYAEEMEDDEAIKCMRFSSDRLLLILRPNGGKILYEGGYVKKFELDTLTQTQYKEDEKLNRTKTKLEIKNIRIQTWVSITAILISIVALLVSILKD